MPKATPNKMALLGSIFSLDDIRKLKQMFDIPLNDLINKERDEIQSMNIISPENISEELLLISLDNQIESPELNNENSPDLIEQFETRYYLFKLIYSDDTEMINTAIKVKDEFYENLVKKICIKFGFESIECPDHLINIVGESLYRVFILNYKSNIINFMLSYILEHKPDYVKKYNQDGRILSFSKRFIKRNDAVIVANLMSIIQDIIDDESLTFDQIIRLLAKYDEGEKDILALNSCLSSISFDDTDNDFRTKFFSIFVKQNNGYSSYISELSESLYKIFPLRQD